MRSRRVSRSAKVCGKAGSCEVLGLGLFPAVRLYSAAACACLPVGYQNAGDGASGDSYTRRSMLMGTAEVQEDGLARLGSGINQGLRQLAERA